MGKVKCLVWDLDNTLWNGILLEDIEITLREGVIKVIRTLDERGILLSIASHNDHNQAMIRLEMLGLQDYFIYPQINWERKSVSIQAIAEALNIGIDSLAFIDDQPYERDEVAYYHPEVLCINAANLDQVLDMPEMMPRFITIDSRRRRHMYQADIQRKELKQNFNGAEDAFLASLDMTLIISPAEEEDLKRVEELTLRTNQLNTTGYTYTYRELDEFRQSDRHYLWVAGLEDRYGSYGKIGLTLIEVSDEDWWIRLFLMSCRVMNRGVGAAFINYIRNRARKSGVRLLADMIPTDRNRMMYMTYKFNHFREAGQSKDSVIFENDLSQEQAYPDYLRLILR